MDQWLWDLDRMSLLGLPQRVFLELFRQPTFLRAVDFVYADIFTPSQEKRKHPGCRKIISNNQPQTNP